MITNSNVTINQYYGRITAIPKIYVKYAVFCILAFICPALLCWYLRYYKVESATILNPDVDKTNTIKCIANNVPAPYEHYQESCWSKKLEKRVEEVSTTIELGYPVKIAITGTPGSGKTDLAKYYAHKHASESSLVWSVVADTPDNLWRSYRLLADELKLGNVDKLPGEDEQGWHERIILRVNQKLAENPNYILIFDNVEKYSEVKQYIPLDGKQKGTIIFTTRDENLTDIENSISISSGLDKEAAVKLLNEVSGFSDDRAASDLAEYLDYLPLNLLIAAKVIRSSKGKGLGYELDYKSYEKHIKSLPIEAVEEEHGGEAKKLYYNKTQFTVIRDAVNQLSTEAKELLIFCSYIAPTGIGRALLENYVRANDKTLSEEMVKHTCKTQLDEIQRFSLLQQIPDQAVHNIHRITQRIGGQSKITPIQANRILEAILLHFPTSGSYDVGTKDAIKYWKPILPHMLVLADDNGLLQNVNQVQHVTLLMYSGRFQMYLGNYAQSLKLFEKAADIGGESVGILILLGEVLKVINPILGRQKLELALKKNTSGNGTRGTILNVLGRVYLELGENDLAEKTFLEALELENVKIGRYNEDDPNRKKTFDNKSTKIGMMLIGLGDTYLKLEKYEEAKRVLEDAEDIMKFHYYHTQNHAHALNLLGAAYTKLGKYENARKKLNEALSIMRSSFGDDSRNVVGVLDNLEELNVVDCQKLCDS